MHAELTVAYNGHVLHRCWRVFTAKGVLESVL